MQRTALKAGLVKKQSGVDEILDHSGSLLAMIVRASCREPGITSFTPNDFSQQIGCLNHPAGKKIEPHMHNPVPREVQFTQEVLFLRTGKLRVDFYEENKNYLGSTTLGAGDAVLLVKGGHGFEVLEPVDIIEVKQGPYVGEQDKTRFPSVAPNSLRWLE